MNSVKIKRMVFPDNKLIENDVLRGYYPLNVLASLNIKKINFDNITIFYGSNGCGKTTLLNLISEKIGCDRNSRFFKDEKYILELKQKVVFFDYANKFFELERELDDEGHMIAIPAIKKYITSDDIFKYIESAKEFNNNSQIINKDIEEETWDMLNEGYRFNGMQDYERLKKYNSARKSTYRYLKNNQIEMKKQLSNGETSLMYYNDNILSNGIYLLDEPENCLSPIFQFKLAKLILEASKYENCQFIISTHSPFFLSIPNAKVYNLDSTPVKEEEWYNLENMILYYDFFTKYKDKFEKKEEGFISDKEFDALIDFLSINNFSNNIISIIRGNEEYITKAYNLIKKYPNINELTMREKLSI